MTRDKMFIALGMVDRQLMILKRQARARHGAHRADWPVGVRAEIDELKGKAKDYRRRLGLRKE